MTALHELARLLGIETSYKFYDGREHRVGDQTLLALVGAMGQPVDGERDARDAVTALTVDAGLPPVLLTSPDRFPVLPVEAAEEVTVELEGGQTVTAPMRRAASGLRLGVRLPMGYHRAHVESGGERRSTVLISAPRRCPTPEELGVEGGWGVGCQTYGLRSARDGGIGDLEDAGRLGEIMAARGADLLGLSPAHAMFPAAAHRSSPYSPSSRTRLNELLVAVDAAARLIGAAPEPTSEGDAERIDYGTVAAAKLAGLARLWSVFKDKHLAAGTDLAGDHRAWAAAQGPDLPRHALFNALQERFLARDPSAFGWRGWPAPWNDAGAAAAQALDPELADRRDFFAFTQWLADRQLGEAQARARAGGMGAGLYLDLAVGVSPDGAAAWGDPRAVIDGATVGAPPGIIDPGGQNWGLAALAPTALKARGMAPLVADLRAVMAHSGAMRIDHVMGLTRLFMIPSGATAHDGTYVRYPFEITARVIALEAQRARCIVVGEDLGTVPEGFAGALRRAGILSMRVLWFERSRRAFKPPQRYSENAVAMLTTHDLATARGFLAGTDVGWRQRLGLMGEKAAAADAAERERQVVQLRDLLRSEGIEPADHETMVEALHHLLGRAASTLVIAQLEDLAGEIEQPNLPGTIDEHPNWRRRLRLTVDELADDPGVAAVLEALMEGRREAQAARTLT